MLGRRAHRPLCLQACACTKAAVDMRLQTAASWCCPPNSRLPPPPLQHVDTQHHNACRAHAVPPRPSAGAGGGCTRQAPGHSRSRWAGAEQGGLGAGGDGGSPTTGLSCRLPRGSELPRRRCGLRHWRKLPVAPCGARCWVAPPTCSSLQPPQSLPSTLPPTSPHMHRVATSQVKVWDVRMFRELHAYYSPAPVEWVDISQRGLLAVGYGRRLQVSAGAEACRVGRVG